jgi:hypothetical protein
MFFSMWNGRLICPHSEVIHRRRRLRLHLHRHQRLSGTSLWAHGVLLGVMARRSTERSGDHPTRPTRTHFGALIIGFVVPVNMPHVVHINDFHGFDIAG